MKRFLISVLIGVGIGLIFAPMPGQDMRRLLSERFSGAANTMRSYATTDASTSMSPTERELKNLGEAATHTQAPDTLVSQPFEPSYPEYVNPERDSAM